MNRIGYQAIHEAVWLGGDFDDYATTVDDRQDTPWLVTGVASSVRMPDMMLPADPDLTILNRFGGTSLIPASERGPVADVERVIATGDIVRLLLDAGSDASIADADGVTALQHAQSKNFAEMAALLEAG